MTNGDERRRRAARARDGGFTLRPPRVDDAAQLAQVHVQCWREAYTGLIRQDYLDALSVHDRTTRWEHILAADPAQRATTWLAVDPAGDIVGFASAGRRRDDDAAVEHELWALYVLARAYGTGTADLLMDRTLGDHPAYLWVADGNARAIAFYRRHGFDTDGVTQVDADLGITELRMTRPTRLEP